MTYLFNMVIFYVPEGIFPIEDPLNLPWNPNSWCLEDDFTHNHPIRGVNGENWGDKAVKFLKLAKFTHVNPSLSYHSPFMGWSKPEENDENLGISSKWPMNYIKIPINSMKSPWRMQFSSHFPCLKNHEIFPSSRGTRTPCCCQASCPGHWTAAVSSFGEFLVARLGL